MCIWTRLEKKRLSLSPQPWGGLQNILPEVREYWKGEGHAEMVKQISKWAAFGRYDPTAAAASLPCRIRASSVSCTTAHGNARSLTHWVSPGTKPACSWVLVRFLTPEAQWELPSIFLNQYPPNKLELCPWLNSHDPRFSEWQQTVHIYVTLVYEHDMHSTSWVQWQKAHCAFSSVS